MRWWGKVIGGTVGLTVGGTPGAVIGAGLGAVADHALDDPPDISKGDLKADGRFVNDEMGRFAEIVFQAPVPPGAIAVAQIESRRGRTIPAEPNYAQDGQFLLRHPIQRGKTRFYIPFSALRYRWKGTYVLRVFVRWSAPGSNGMQDIGQAAFGFPLPRPRGWSQVDFLSPLIGLCSEVAHANGDPHPTVPHHVETFFLESLHLPAQQAQRLRVLLDTRPAHDVETLAHQVLRRTPELRPMTILALLAEIARKGGAPTRRARTVIRDVSEHLGIPSHRWPEVRDRLRMVVNNPWAMLEVEPGATPREIKRAYRSKLKGLHPDRVAGLDHEIQELAESRTIELREAYEACLDAVT
jgi:DnaJ-domain-containing protein 1